MTTILSPHSTMYTFTAESQPSTSGRQPVSPIATLHRVHQHHNRHSRQFRHPRTPISTCRAQGSSQSWGGEVPDWELNSGDSNEDEETDTDLMPPNGGGGGGGEFVVQNVLAVVLLSIIAFSCAAVLFKLVVVGFALVSAAVRYSFIGILLFILLCIFSF